MTDQPNQQATISEELGLKWGGAANQLFLAIITLEKKVAAQDDFILQMTKNEAALVDRIQEMEEELAGLRPPPSSLSPELQALADAGREAIRGE